MKTQTAIDKAGSVKELAGIFGVSVQAVYQWVKRGDLPELKVYKLRELRPEWFALAGAPAERHAQLAGDRAPVSEVLQDWPGGR